MRDLAAERDTGSGPEAGHAGTRADRPADRVSQLALWPASADLGPAGPLARAVSPRWLPQL